MPTVRLPTGIVEFELPAAAELIPENGPAFGSLAFGPDRLVFYILQIVDLTGVDDIVENVLNQALDEHEQLEAIQTDRSDIFEEVLSIAVDREGGDVPVRYFLRLNRPNANIVRLLKIAPGRSNGESEQERRLMDELGREVAAAAKFSPALTGLDRASGRPGTTILHIPNRILCPLPTDWTVHDMEEIDPDWTPDPDGGEAVVCLGPEERASMFVSTESLARDEPAKAAELTDELSELWEQDRDRIAGLHGMGTRVDGTDPTSGRYLFRGDFEAAKPGVEGRHYVLRAIAPRQMVTVQMTPILTDETAGPEEAAALLDPLDSFIRRAHLFLHDE